MKRKYILLVIPKNKIPVISCVKPAGLINQFESRNFKQLLKSNNCNVAKGYITQNKISGDKLTF